MNVAAVLITHNEELNIKAAVQSVSWASEIVVVDAFSTDSTPDLCRELGVRFFQKEWEGYVSQKNFAIQQARLNWVLSLDADERVSAELRQEILALPPQPHQGYRIPRRKFFLNQWIEHTSWSPDYQLRLFEKEKAQWRGGRLHESVRLDGSSGVLANPLLHYSYQSISDFLKRLDVYSRLSAEDCFERGVRVKAPHLLAHPAAAFLRSYVAKRGFQDGLAGLSVSMLAAISVFFRYLKVLEMERREK